MPIRCFSSDGARVRPGFGGTVLLLHRAGGSALLIGRTGIFRADIESTVPAASEDAGECAGQEDFQGGKQAWDS